MDDSSHAFFALLTKTEVHSHEQPLCLERFQPHMNRRLFIKSMSSSSAFNTDLVLTAQLDVHRGPYVHTSQSSASGKLTGEGPSILPEGSTR